MEGKLGNKPLIKKIVSLYSRRPWRDFDRTRIDAVVEKMRGQMERLMPEAEPDQLEFSPPLLRLQEVPPNPLGRWVLKAALILLGCLFLWAILGRLDIVAVAEGKLVPQTYVKIVQPAEAGIVKEILTKEGETVKAGQVLMRMDTLITDADASSMRAEYARKRLALQRIDAELAGGTFQPDSNAPPQMAREAEAQFKANRAALAAALAEERSRLQKAQQDLFAAEQVCTKLENTLPHYRDMEKAFDKLVKEGAVAVMTASDKRRERIEKEQELRAQEYVVKSAKAGVLQSQKTLAQIESDYRRQLYTERNEVANAVDRLSQEVAKQTHRQELLELKAPQSGVVKDLATHTSGTVVQPGTVLLTLVPQNETLRAEVWVTNEDIGFVRPGQPVKLKFVAFPFQKYGMAEGTVEHVSADATDPTATNGNGAPPSDATGKPMPFVYKALVTMKTMVLETDGERFPLTAGMRTNAEIVLGTRTVAEYLLSPVQKAWHESGRER
ncbi:MAG: HlyD family type I secretion periplasmic adaptor subunit [Thermodesulfobacteriota bacterium]